MRFTHANRHCPDHPYDQLKRSDDFVIQAVTEQNHEVMKWLEKYKMEKEDRTPTRKTPRRPKTTSLSSSSSSSIINHSMESISSARKETNENINLNLSECDENHFPVTPSNPYKSRKGLMVELDMNAGLGTSPITSTKTKLMPKVIRWNEPNLSQEEDSADEFESNNMRSTFNPKKRWLREAWHDDLAKPLEQNNGQSPLTSTIMTKTSTPTTTAIQSSINNVNPNQMRPTVLMVASKDKTMPMISITSKTNELNSYDKQLNEIQPRSATSQNKRYSPVSNGMSTTNNGTSMTITTAINDRNLFINDNKTSIVTSTNTNRKWLGALALMQLAADENSSVCSTNASSMTSSTILTGEQPCSTSALSSYNNV